jgi:flagella basal body P-ring formation protein FlgA
MKHPSLREIKNPGLRLEDIHCHKIAYLLFIFLFLLTLATPSSALQITFRQKARVTGNSVTLGDIARFDDKSEMAKALASQKVAMSPPPGGSIVLRSLTIKKNLCTENSLPATLDWNGSPSVILSRTGIKINSAKIQAIIAEFLSDNKADLMNAEIRFIPASLPIPFTLPAGDLSYEVIPSNPNIFGSSKFSIIFRVDDRVAKNMSVKGKIEALSPVVVTTGKLQKGTVLTSDSLTLVVKDISELKAPGMNLEQFIGKRLKRTIRAGAAVSTAMVESCPVIKRGERVKIVINHGSMHLSTAGIARNDGTQDQMIRVQNINSNKIVYCRVSAPGLVEVVL